MSEALNDEMIIGFSASVLLSSDAFDRLYDIEDELERNRIKALLIAKAREFKIEKEYISVLKAYDKANQKLADEYTRQNAINNAEIPLVFDSKGRPAETIDNFLLILRQDEKFSGIKYNLLSYSPENHVNRKISAWEDTDDSSARNYIEKKYKLYSQTKLEDALKILFKERSYHPIKDIIEGTSWDGVERIPTLLTKWLKCENTGYTREVSRLIFAGGINRLYNNGCKFDDVPIFVGTKQGEGKSTFVRWLAIKDEFFNEVGEVEGQRGMEAVKGAWICEMAELLALTKTKEVEAVKSYITRLEDVYRAPYERRVSKFKRQCIFIGTTNKEQFLTDKTGNRRFYPVKIYQSGYELFDNSKQIKADILQCWSEAKVKFDKGEMPPYADPKILEEIRKNQADAVEDDYRVGMIESYLSNKTQVCIIELWQNALKNENSKPTKRDSNDIALILQNYSEWERVEKAKRIDEYGIQKVWVKKENAPIILDESEYETLPFE